MIKHRLAFMAGVLWVSAVAAQPWQWQLYDGDYYNPSGFPEVTGGGMWNEYAPETTGNLDGLGADEFIRVDSAQVTLGVHLDNQGYRWTTLHVNQDLVAGNSATGVATVDLDNDSAEELIVFSDTISCWKTMSTNPWTWQRRDDLLESLYFPPLTHNAILGDYDGNGLLNELIHAGDPTDDLQMWERSADGEWEMAPNLYPGGWGGFYDGDFDHDGDLDFAIVDYVLDLDESVSRFYENTGDGILEIGASIDLPGPQGGDVDGDGLSEALGIWGDSGCFLQEVEPDSQSFLHVISAVPLSRLTGQILGNLHTPAGVEVVGVQDIHVSFDICYWCSRFVTRYHTDTQWTYWESGFTRMSAFNSFFNIHSSLADLDGDGLKDIFQQQTAYSAEEWWVWKNTGSAQADAFGICYRITRFINNTDTSFTSPQIGDISGDGRAELGMIVGIGDQPPRVMFFQMLGGILDTTFELRSDWSDGLDAVFDKIRLADIDNDGCAEVIGLSAGTWHSYFRRNGLWQEYMSILPPVTSDDVEFADADNDGDLDLLTPDDVWLSLTPDKANDPFIPHPLSFILSAYPNPFNSTTTISYSLPVSGVASVLVFNIEGQEVATLVKGYQAAGMHKVKWDAAGLSSGIYLCRVSAGGRSLTNRVFLLK
jgi:hypothetical protein